MCCAWCAGTSAYMHTFTSVYARMYVCMKSHACIHSFIHSGYFYNASSSPQVPQLLRGAPDTARMLCLSFTPKRHMQLRVKDLYKVPTWRLEHDSNPRPFGRKETKLPMCLSTTPTYTHVCKLCMHSCVHYYMY